MLSIIDYKFKKVSNSLRFQILFTVPIVTYTTENKLNKFLSYVDGSTGELKDIVKVSITPDNKMQKIIVNPEFITEGQLRLLSEIIQEEFRVYLNNSTVFKVEVLCESI